jgi:hypothetical protein
MNLRLARRFLYTRDARRPGVRTAYTTFTPSRVGSVGRNLKSRILPGHSELVASEAAAPIVLSHGDNSRWKNGCAVAAESQSFWIFLSYPTAMFTKLPSIDELKGSYRISICDCPTRQMVAVASAVRACAGSLQCSFLMSSCSEMISSRAPSSPNSRPF